MRPPWPYERYLNKERYLYYEAGIALPLWMEHEYTVLYWIEKLRRYMHVPDQQDRTNISISATK